MTMTAVSLGRLLLLLLSLRNSAALDSISYIIINYPDGQLFESTATAVGYFDTLFGDVTQNLTVFMPTDAMISQSPQWSAYLTDPDIFNTSLRMTINEHIIQGQGLSTADLFREDGIFPSLQDNLYTTALYSTIEDAEITASIQAANGWLHVVSAVFKPKFFSSPLSNLEGLPEFGPDRDVEQRIALTDVVDFLGARHLFDEIKPKGMTHVGCRLRAFNRMNDYWKDSIIGTREGDILTHELLNASMKKLSTDNFIDYSLIDQIYIDTEIDSGYEELRMSRNGCAHMWITKHDQKLCFNDACMVIAPEAFSPAGTPETKRWMMHSNGVAYAVDRCVICPGVAMLSNYAGVYTMHNMKTLSEFFISSEWNLRNLSLSVGDGGPVTLFAAVSTGWSLVTGIDQTRLLTDMWKPHQWDFLRHMMIQGNYTEAELRQMVKNAGGTLNLTSLANQTLTLELPTEDEKLKLDGGDLFFPDIRGVDGALHFVTQVPLVRSVTHSVYDIAWFLGGFFQQINLIDSVFLRSDMKRLEPLTALFAPDIEWSNKIIELDEIEPVLENHLFTGLLWCHTLLEKSKTREQIESQSGNLWSISENQEGMPCFDTIAAFGDEIQQACVTECDILARNGIVLVVDKVLLVTELPTRGPTPALPPSARAPTKPSGGLNRPSGEGGGPGEVNGYTGPTPPVSFSRPQRLYEWDQLDVDYSGAIRPPLALGAILPLLMLL